MDIGLLETEMKQGWSSSKVVLYIGNKEVATVHHSGGNGLSETDALNVAKQIAKTWNEVLNKKQNEITQKRR